jgi:protein TonB
MKSRKLKLNQPSTLLMLIAGLAFWAPAARAEINLVNDFDERPVPVKAVPPVYPPAMQQAGVSGIVTVSMLIDEKGNVVEREVAKSTRHEFEDAALEAVKKWKFKPAQKAGTPVKAKIKVPIEFSYQA